MVVNSNTTQLTESSGVKKLELSKNDKVDTSYIGQIQQIEELSISPKQKPTIKKKKVSRCSHSECNTKLKLSDIVCRCGEQFCNVHRYSDKHNCSYDYKQLGKQQLIKNNPKVIANKI